MRARNHKQCAPYHLAVLCCLATVIFSSCSAGSGIPKNATTSVSAAAGNQGSHSSTASGSQSSQAVLASQTHQPDFTADVVKQAEEYHTTPGRIALSMLICKLDDSYDYSEQTAKSAKELFNILNEIAFKNNVTLESLDSNFGLSAILASENINVIIEANDVSSLPQTSTSSSQSKSNPAAKETSQKSATASEPEPAWVSKFQKEIIQPVG